MPTQPTTPSQTVANAKPVLDLLTAALADWYTLTAPGDDALEVCTVAVRFPDLSVAAHGLTTEQARELGWALRDAAAAYRTRAARLQRVEQMADLLAGAARDGADPGQTLCDALATAAARLHQPRTGPARPGSWEAEFVMRLADRGFITGEQTGPVADLAALLAEVGQSRNATGQWEDGGETVALACGLACDRLGAFSALLDPVADPVVREMLWGLAAGNARTATDDSPYGYVPDSNDDPEPAGA